FVTPTGATLDYARFKQMMSEPEQEFDHLTFELVATGLHDVGENRYLGETDHVYRWKETGEISNIEHRVMVFVVGEGKIRRMKFFVKPGEAWAAAGVERP